MIISRIICLVIGYICGLFQTGYIYGKSQNIDIREHGSGNAGATNTLRTLGWKAGVITFAGDLGKAILAIFLAWVFFHKNYPDAIKVLQMYAGLGTVLGHNYPFYLKFKGGKGIACTAGFIVACFIQIAPLCLLLFIGAVVVTKYVSLGSILVAFSFYLQLILFTQTGIISVSPDCLTEMYVIGAVFSLMALWRHRENIKRLIKGTENKVGFGKKEA